jgi:cellulose synthase/poly-beta-1,6-N-acetylglucosamine synthase-like glycosyltransferase
VDRVADAAATVLVTLDWAVLGYFFALNSSYLVLIALAAVDFTRTVRSAPFAGYDRAFASPLTPPVSVLVPAHDEEAGIVQAVHAMLTLRYPTYEVVVIEDGSADRTFERLRETFDLVEVPRVLAADVPTAGAVLSTHVAGDGRPLLVVRKVSTGTKTDALNVGINAAQYPLLCMVDADALLDEDALLRVAKPFVDDPWRVVATGGVVRAANGCRVERGRVIDVRMPRGWLVRIQIVEYLRAFLLGRAGWSRLNSLLVISGAFGLFRRDLVVEVGGLDPNTLGEDAELVVRLHHHLRRQGRDYRVVFVAEPVCWTEIPATLAVLGRQRRRWARGLAELLWKHRGMTGNPRYGRVGLLGMPYYVVFEALSPVVELGGVLAVLVGLALGLVNETFAVLFLLAAVGYGVLLSVAALTIEEFAFHRYPRWRDLGVAVAAALLENVGYRQLHSWWRLRGLVSMLRGRPGQWGSMPRAGFDEEPERPAGVR